MRQIAVLVVGGIFFATLAAQANPDSISRMKRHVNTLTQPAWQGRATGVGAPLAAEWLVLRLDELGLEPAGEDGWFVGHQVPVDLKAKSTFQMGAKTLAPDHEFQVLGFSDDLEYSGDGVFVGYGISAAHLGHDSYQGIDPVGKVVLAFTGIPKGLELGVRDEHLASLESKAAVALAKGARGIVFINDPRAHGDGADEREDKLALPNVELPLKGLAAVRISERVALEAFADVGADLAAMQAEADSNSPSPLSVELRLTLQIERSFAESQNIVAKIPGGEGPLLFLAAHYDGLSQARAGKDYTGADDNASGVAVVLELARRLSQEPVKNREVYVVFHDAEELGLFGSRRTAHWLKARGMEGKMLNLDMVGRLRESGLRFHGNAEECLQAQKSGKSTKLEITCDQPAASPSDHWPYLRLGFEAVSLTTGRTVDYHQHTDRAEKLNFPGMLEVTGFAEHYLRAQAD